MTIVAANVRLNEPVPYRIEDPQFNVPLIFVAIVLFTFCKRFTEEPCGILILLSVITPVPFPLPTNWIPVPIKLMPPLPDNKEIESLLLLKIFP